MWLFIAFLIVPLIEIALFVQVGGLLGLWPTLLIVVLTAIFGTVLVRSQGMQTLGNLQRSMETGKDPSRDLAHGVMILFSGFLLLTPGFFTDAVGFALLVPGIRDAIFARLASQIAARGSMHMQFGQAPGASAHGRPQSQSSGQTVIDGEFTEIDPDDLPPKPGTRPSGWTRD
ncbi:MAG: FxsA family protein [Mangrovicoccus sp.]|nr:FxsA family protein [Mangrovicoccus sp.]